MSRPRWNKVLADLWDNRARSLLVVASITVGLFAIGVVATDHLVIAEDMRIGYAAIHPANIRLRTYPFEPALVDHMERMEGVDQAQGEYVLDLRAESGPGEWIAVDLHAIPDLQEAEIDQVALEEGRWPSEQGEILFDRYKLEEVNAQVGETLRLELPSGRVREVELVGVVHDQTIGVAGIGAGFFLAPPQGYISMDTLTWLEAPYAFNQLNLTVEGDGTDERWIRQVSDRVRDELERNGVEVVSGSVRSSTDHPNRTFVDALAGILFLLGLLTVFLSGFLITNTLGALLAQQMEQIGVMKTVGARRRQISGIYMALILVFSLLALLIAVPLAHRVAFAMSDFMAAELNFVLRGERALPEVILLQALIALGVPQLAAFVPIWRGVRVSVREALSGFRQDQPPQLGWLDRRLTRLRRLSLPLLLALRNVFRSRGRLILTLTTLSLGGAIFISTFNVRVSMLEHVEQVSRYFLADVNLSLDQEQRTNEVSRLLGGLPGVAHVEAWTAAPTELVLEEGTAGEAVQLLGVPPESTLIEPKLLDGRWIRPGDQNAVALSDRFRTRFPDLEVGDSIQLSVEGEQKEWVVVGFFQLSGKSGGFPAYTTYEYLSRLTHGPSRAREFRIVAAQRDLERAEQEELGRRIEAALEARGMRVREVTAGAFLSELASEGFAILTGFLLFLALLTALVGSIGLAGTMSMNVMERTREIGVLRAVGASDRILMRMVIVEGLTIGLLSWVLGAFLAIPISRIMSDSVSQALFDAPSTFGLTPTGFALWLGVVLALSALASVLPARGASRLTIREVLAYE